MEPMDEHDLDLVFEPGQKITQEKFSVVKGVANRLRKDIQKTKRQVEYFEYNHIGFYMKFFDDWAKMADVIGHHQDKIEFYKGTLGKLLYAVPEMKKALGDCIMTTKGNIEEFQLYINQFSAEMNKEMRKAMKSQEETSGNELNAILENIVQLIQTGEKPKNTGILRGVNYVLLEKVYQLIQSMKNTKIKKCRKLMKNMGQLKKELSGVKTGVSSLANEYTQGVLAYSEKKNRQIRTKLEERQKEVNYLGIIMKSKQNLNQTIIGRLRDSQMAISKSFAKGFSEISKTLEYLSTGIANFQPISHTFNLETSLSPQSRKEASRTSIKTQFNSLKATLFPGLTESISSQLNSFSTDLSCLQLSIEKAIRKQPKDENSFNHSEIFTSDHLQPIDDQTQGNSFDFIVPAPGQCDLRRVDEDSAGVIELNIDVLIYQEELEQSCESTPQFNRSLATDKGAEIQEYSSQIKSLKENTINVQTRTEAIENEIKTEYNRKVILLKKLQAISELYNLQKYPSNSSLYNKLLEYQDDIKLLEGQLIKSQTFRTKNSFY